MFSNRKWQQRALILNLAGTALLFYSFQATSSNFKLVTVKDRSIIGALQEQSAICIYGRAVMMQSSAGDWGMGSFPCPDWEHAKAAAVVNIEHPGIRRFRFRHTAFRLFHSVPICASAPNNSATTPRIEGPEAQEKLGKSKSD